MKIKILVNGAKGKMGAILSKTLKNTNGFELSGESNSKEQLKIYLHEQLPDVVVDLTTPQSVFDNSLEIINAGVRPVIGTSGLTEPQIQQLQDLCKQANLGGIIAPNFSLGAMLMLKCSKILASNFSKAEIIELHHEQKLDIPSFTSKYTADTIYQTQTTAKNSITGEQFKGNTPPPIHSIRLPGLLAHQRVIFGSTGETLTIQHDSIDRECFMPGILFACKKAIELDHLVYGLENLV